MARTLRAMNSSIFSITAGRFCKMACTKKSIQGDTSSRLKAFSGEPAYIWNVRPKQVWGGKGKLPWASWQFVLGIRP